jgi:hypothetical protein
MKEKKQQHQQQAVPASSSSSPSVSSKAIAKTKSKKRTEKAIGQFLSEILPTLKKEMVRRKKEPFSWSNYEAFLKPDSGYVQTYILPLFKFLEKDEIICSRYGCFENRHMVKTSFGFDRVMTLSRHCDAEELTPDVLTYLTQRYGKEWFKIPAKDGFRAKAAAATGHEGCFKIILTDLFEDTFQDVQTGQTIRSINPSLVYEPCRPPPVKKEREKKPRKVKEGVDEEEDEENEEKERMVFLSPAQEVPLEKMEEKEEGEESD